MPGNEADDPIECISAVTLVVSEMARALSFYEALGFVPISGGPDAPFTSLRVGPGFLNLQLAPATATGAGSGTGTGCDTVWGRIIFWVDDVDAVHARAIAAGHTPLMEPSDAPWGERYFHIHDPDGHELSFAKRLSR